MPFVVIMSCRYEGIQELYETIYHDRAKAEAFASAARERYIASRIDGIERSIEYAGDPGLIAKMGSEWAARSKEQDSAELVRWKNGEFDTDGDGRVESYSWRVIEMREDG